MGGLQRVRVAAAAAAATVVMATSCGAPAPRSDASGGGADSQPGRIVVLAAASLTEPFTELGRRFEGAHPAAPVTFSFDGSSAHVAQVVAGAPADLLVTADEETMRAAVDAGAVRPPEVVAHNRLAITVAAGNPKGVSSLADLRHPGVVVVLCAPEVPCGRSAARSLAHAGVDVEPGSFEPSVKAVLTKVALGEADAGIVYVSDIRTAGARVAGVEIPVEHNVATPYLMATIVTAPNPAGAEAFAAFVRSPAGQEALAAAGLQPR